MDITLTDAQLKAVKQLDATKTAQQIVQIHVETWLAPFVAELTVDDAKVVLMAYKTADATVQTRVRTDLGLV